MNIRSSLLLVALPLSACSSSTSGVTSDGGASADGAVADGGSTPGADGGGSSGGTQCTAAREQSLPPIDKVSTGAVSVVSDAGGTKTIYVDASAGGSGNSGKSPRVYVDLGAGARVDVTDKSAATSKDWDLAIKRTVIFTNSGDGGPGTGGAATLSKAFASVSAADVSAANPVAEAFFKADCELNVDQIGQLQTTFSGWYDYEESKNIPTPKPNVTYVVRGGTGRQYKVAIKAYDALPDGGSRNNASTGFYLLEVAEVTGP